MGCSIYISQVQILKLHAIHIGISIRITNIGISNIGSACQDTNTINPQLLTTHRKLSDRLAVHHRVPAIIPVASHGHLELNASHGLTIQILEVICVDQRPVDGKAYRTTILSEVNG